MRTLDSDALDRVQRPHFDDGSQAVTTGFLWVYRLVRTKHHLKDAGGYKHSPIAFGYLRIPGRFYYGGLVAHTQLALKDRFSVSDLSPQVP